MIIGKTYNLFKSIEIILIFLCYALTCLAAVTLPKFGINVKFAESDKPEHFSAAIDSNTKALYCEIISNPKYNVGRIPELAKVTVST